MDTIEENWKQFKEAIETCIERDIPKDSNLAINLSLDDMRSCLIPSQFSFI
jgi:hypothetical protein